jgi:hypothetical protein
MSRSMVIMVSDNADSVEATKRAYQGGRLILHFKSIRLVSGEKDLESPFFRQQLTQGVPALSPRFEPASP